MAQPFQVWRVDASGRMRRKAHKDRGRQSVKSRRFLLRATTAILYHKVSSSEDDTHHVRWIFIHIISNIVLFFFTYCDTNNIHFYNLKFSISSTRSNQNTVPYRSPSKESSIADTRRNAFRMARAPWPTRCSHLNLCHSQVTSCQIPSRRHSHPPYGYQGVC